MSSSKLANIESQVITRQAMRFVWDISTECWLQGNKHNWGDPCVKGRA